jgi:nucleoside-diphosphate-sugar epimerase
VTDDRVAALVIFGASGFVGGHVRRAAPAWARDVLLVTRRSTDPAPHERVIHGDLREPSSFAPALPTRSVVVNLAFDTHAPADVNLAMADGLAAAGAACAASRLVHLSTATVVGPCPDRWISEDTPCRPATPYQRTKLAIEARLREHARGTVPLVVLRPTAVFGENGLNLKKLTDDLRTRPRIESYVRACLYGGRAMHLVPVETVIAAVRFAATSPRAIDDGLYHVAADEAPENNFADVERIVRRGLGLRDRRVEPIRLPMAALTAVLKASGRYSLNPAARFSSDRLRHAGFTPPVTFADALERYAAAARDTASKGDPASA